MSSQTNPQRLAWITGLRPEKASYYKALHADPWPGVLKTLKECNFQNFSIHLKEIEGKLYLFAYLEYNGTDMGKDMQKMASDPETQRWWLETKPCQLPLPGTKNEDETWVSMEEVFFLK